MSHKYPLGTILKSIDKHKFYIVTSCRDINCPCEDCAFNGTDCYERIPKELGINIKPECSDIFGDDILKLIPEGGL